MLVIVIPVVPPVEREYFTLVRFTVNDVPAAELEATTLDIVRVSLSLERAHVREAFAPAPAEHVTASVKRDIGELADGFQNGTLITS